MSAFICNDETISVLARAFFDYQVSFEGLPPKSDLDYILCDVKKEVNQIGQALLQQNYDSVNYRYRTNELTPEFQCKDVNYDEGTVLGCIACYEYQACETEGYHDSYIHKNIERLKDKILARLVRKLKLKVPYGYGNFDMTEDY